MIICKKKHKEIKLTAVKIQLDIDVNKITLFFSQYFL